MREVKVSSRYAKSLLGLAVEKNKLEEVHNDMRMILEVCDDSRDLQILLKSPIIKTDKKEAILKELFRGKLSDITLTFVDIIIRKKREYLLTGIAEAFESQYKTYKNIQTVEVISAVALDKATQDKITSLVKEQHDGGIDLIQKVDPEIIGGLIIRIGDRQIDESIKRKLSDLERAFSKNEYIKEI